MLYQASSCYCQYANGVKLIKQWPINISGARYIGASLDRQYLAVSRLPKEEFTFVHKYLKIKEEGFEQRNLIF